MDISIWLFVGLGCIAFVIGYLAGGSKSPVVSGMIAGIFGLITLTTGVITGSDLVKKLDEVKTSVTTQNTASASIQKTLDDIKNALPKSTAGSAPTAQEFDKKIDEINK